MNYNSMKIYEYYEKRSEHYEFRFGQALHNKRACSTIPGKYKNIEKVAEAAHAKNW